MKVHLMSPSADFDPAADPPPHAADLTQDLQLEPVLAAMAAGDPFILDMTRAALLAGCSSVAQVEHRQRVLSDCANNRATARELYDMSTTLMADRARIHRSNIFLSTESRLHMAVQVLEVCLPHLRRLRDLAEAAGPSFASPGFRRFFAILRDELDYAYLHDVERELARLGSHGGMLLSAALGEGNTGVDFVLRAPDETKRSFFHRIPLPKPSYTVTIPERDDASFNALGELRGHAVAAAARAASESVNHVIDFFTVMRQEMAFYIGCLNLTDALEHLGHEMCLATVEEPGTPHHHAAGLYDAALALENNICAVASDLETEHAPIVIITGANRGGKSTFLRAVGIAALLSRCGAYVPARSWVSPLYVTVHTHFRREEDEQMAAGKFDEELTRMGAVADRLHPGSLFLSNESFSSTNEREGSQIAEDILRGLADAGVEVVMVTHLFELADRLRTGPAKVTFLRAERRTDGRRSYRILPGQPEPTSHAMDLYRGLLEQSRPTADGAGPPAGTGPSDTRPATAETAR